MSRFVFRSAPELLVVLLVAACMHAPKPAAQNPSPMIDFTRAHERLQKRTIEGVQFTAGGQAEVLVTPRATAAGEADLLIHFHGAAWLPFQAAISTGRPLVVAVLNAGQGGGIYDRTFRDPAVLDGLLDDIRARAAVRVNRLYLSGFSAGYGAIRAILRNVDPSPAPSGHPLPAARGEGSRARDPLPLAGEGAAERRVRVAGILLLDGLHTSYNPEQKPLAEGGKLDTAPLEPFLKFAREAVAGRKRFVFTHSEIFPGTFASTTETADYLLHELSLKPAPVVRWGPRGMQQLSDVRSGGLIILGFAGNSAPDHVDHFHGMPEFLQLLFEGGSQ